MCRICLVHTQPSFFRVGKHARGQQGFLAWTCAEFLFLFFICLEIGRIFELALQDCCCTHSGAATIEGAPPSEAKPRFIPQKYQIGFYCETLLHDALDVIDVAVKGTIRQDQESSPV